MELQELLLSQFLQKPKGWVLPQSVIGIDPGMTTGYCRFVHYPFQGYILEDNGVIKVNKETGWDPIIEMLQGFYNFYPHSVVVCEDYRIYPSKDKVHVLSSVDTVRIIGAIEYMCHHDHIPLVKQMAGMAKGFVTDEKLKEWWLYNKVNRHSRDSIRHAIYFLLFNKGY